jgi:hypothetical protein
MRAMRTESTTYLLLVIHRLFYSGRAATLVHELSRTAFKACLCDDLVVRIALACNIVSAAAEVLIYLN